MLRSCTIILSPFPLNFSSLTLLCTFNNWKYYVLWMLCNASCSAGFKNFQVLWRTCKNGKFRDSYKASLNVMCFVQMAKLNSLRKWTLFVSFLKIWLETGFVTKWCEWSISTLPVNTREQCPLLFKVLDTLLLHKTDGREVSDMRVRNAVHSLSILLSVKSQKIQNDFKILLTCVCISFGVGKRLLESWIILV